MKNVWQPLNHHTIIKAVEEATGEKLNSLLIQRNSYINRVYELEKAADQQRIIVKFYRPERWQKELILEELNFLGSLKEAEINVIAPLSYDQHTLFDYQGIFFAIFPKKGGRSLDEFDKESWQEIGRLIARMHLTGQSCTDSLRIVWTPQTATRNHLDIILQGDHLPPNFRDSLQNSVELLIAKTAELFADESLFLIHGDCHRGNLIHRPGEGIFIVDFDDSSIGPAVQDLWMLLPGSPEETEQELEWFLSGYETFREFRRGSLQLIPALRAMRIIHYAAWCELQSSDPGFEEQFPDWGTTRYWNETIREVQALVNYY